MAQNIPINQQNALPLATIAQATPGAIQLLGGQVSRSWTPSDLGMDGVPASIVNVPGSGLNYYLATPFLDMRGCARFAVLIRRTTTAGGAGLIALPTTAPWIQLRLTPTDTPPIFLFNGGSTSNNLTGTFVIKTPAVLFPAAGGVGEQQSILLAWGGMQLGSYGADIAGGTDIRIVLAWFTNLVDPSNSFQVSVWAGS